MDLIDSERMSHLRSRILRRSRNPCSGRFDSAWDVEQEFLQDLSDYTTLLNRSFENCHSLGNISGAHYVVGLIEEAKGVEKFVRGSWHNQDAAISRSRELSDIPRPSITLDDFV